MGVFKNPLILLKRAQIPVGLGVARKNGVDLRQSYARKGRNAAFMANRYMATRKTGRGRKMIKCVRNYPGGVMRDIERAIATDPSLDAT